MTVTKAEQLTWKTCSTYITGKLEKDEDIVRALCGGAGENISLSVMPPPASIQSAGAMIDHWPQRRLHSRLQVELFAAGNLM
jgi:hypothetical protein